MLHLQELWALKDDVVGEFLEKCRLALGLGRHHEFEAVAVGLGRHEMRALAQPTRLDKPADFHRENVFEPVAADRIEQ